ncbi:MAG: hypothetical protein WC483_01625 [Candidatus Paceibacterota bacterium]
MTTSHSRPAFSSSDAQPRKGLTAPAYAGLPMASMKKVIPSISR